MPSWLELNRHSPLLDAAVNVCHIFRGKMMTVQHRLGDFSPFDGHVSGGNMGKLSWSIKCSLFLDSRLYLLQHHRKMLFPASTKRSATEKTAHNIQGLPFSHRFGSSRGFMLKLQGFPHNLKCFALLRHAESTRDVGCASQQAPPNSSPNFLGIVMTSAWGRQCFWCFSIPKTAVWGLGSLWKKWRLVQESMESMESPQLWETTMLPKNTVQKHGAWQPQVAWQQKTLLLERCGIGQSITTPPAMLKKKAWAGDNPFAFPTGPLP